MKKKIDWGLKLVVGSMVNVSLSGPNLSLKACVKSIVRYKGPIRKEPGTYFGVEILVGF